VPEQLPTQHDIGTRIEDAQQAPQLVHFRLDRGRRGEQEVPRTRPDAQHEVEQEDQDRTIAWQHRDHSTRRQRQRLAYAHLVRQ
jgi:hypothetical protein